MRKNYVAPCMMIEPCPGQIAMDSAYFMDEKTRRELEKLTFKIDLLKRVSLTPQMREICKDVTGLSPEELLEYMENAKSEQDNVLCALRLYEDFTTACLLEETQIIDT